jgi:hypothetical protein
MRADGRSEDVRMVRSMAGDKAAELHAVATWNLGTISEFA